MLVELAAAVLLQGLVDVLAELVVGAGRVAARADDPEVPRHQALAVQVEEAGEQLAAGQIAGGAEHHEHTI